MALELAFAIADTRTPLVFVFDLHRRCVYQEIAPEVVRCRGRDGAISRHEPIHFFHRQAANVEKLRWLKKTKTLGWHGWSFFFAVDDCNFRITFFGPDLPKLATTLCCDVSLCHHPHAILHSEHLVRAVLGTCGLRHHCWFRRWRH